MSTRPPIRVIDLAGSPDEIGAAHGAAFADEIREYAADRVALVAGGAWSGGPMATGDVLALADSMLPAHERFDAALHTEMLALAGAAGISPAEAVIVGGFTDFVDTVRAEVGQPVPIELIEDDCTAVIVPDERADGAGFYAQTWDMHDSATDHVVLLRIRPDDRPSARVFTTTGCLGQIGMNEVGVCVGINNLTGTDGQIGVTWPSVVRRMLATTDAEQALDVLLGAELAGAHNFLIFDAAGRGFNVEAMPSTRVVTELDGDPLAHTNHVLDADARKVEANDRSAALVASSTTRLAKAGELLADGDVDAERLMELTREPTAICQRPIEPYHIESSGAAVMRPATGEFWACWGQPASNEYEVIAP